MRQKKGFEARLSAARDQATAALDIFERAAVRLEAAADAADGVVQEVEVEVMRLRGLRDDAHRLGASHRARADKIREFLK